MFHPSIAVEMDFFKMHQGQLSSLESDEIHSAAVLQKLL